jgi:hypothetical protein
MSVGRSVGRSVEKDKVASVSLSISSKQEHFQGRWESVSRRSCGRPPKLLDPFKGSMLDSDICTERK